MTDAPEQIAEDIACAYSDLSAVDLCNLQMQIESALKRVKAAAYRQGVEDAAKAVDEAGYYCVPPYDETGSLPEQIDHSIEAIRTLEYKPEGE